LPAALLEQSHPSPLPPKSAALAERADAGTRVGLQLELTVDPVGLPVLLQPGGDAVPGAVHVVGGVDGSHQVAARFERRQRLVGQHRNASRKNN